MNVLEEIVAEWREYTGHFVRRNVRVTKLSHGGYGGELDILAYDPKTKTLEHWEPSSAAKTTAVWQAHYAKKFQAQESTYREVIPLPIRTVRKIAVFKYTKKRGDAVELPPGVEHMTIPSVMRQIRALLLTQDPLKKAIPEGFPLLRGMQLSVWYGGE